MIKDEQLIEIPKTKERLYTGAILNLEKWQVTLPNGKLAPREIVLHGGAAAIVPVDERGHVTLVRQYRAAIGEFTWEIPAGKLDSPGEDPLSCAKRELAEETGFTAASWRLLCNMVSTPGFSNERIHLYLATDLTGGQTHPDQDEFIATLSLPLDEAIGWVTQGKLFDAKTCLALLLAKQVLV
ncbi:MAG: NUDIX hydrolase [Christensenellales bacterium]|jgi:ADP-ribose pyrophosphatase|nr:NUDIX hydrolase [Clostridiales bacterium]